MGCLCFFQGLGQVLGLYRKGIISLMALNPVNPWPAVQTSYCRKQLKNNFLCVAAVYQAAICMLDGY